MTGHRREPCARLTLGRAIARTRRGPDLSMRPRPQESCSPRRSQRRRKTRSAGDRRPATCPCRCRCRCLFLRRYRRDVAQGEFHDPCQLLGVGRGRLFHGALKRLLRTQTCTRSVQLSSSVKWASTIIHMMASEFDWNPRGLGLLLGSPTLARTPSRLPLNLGHSRKALAARGDGLLHAAPDRRVTFLARSSLGGNSQRRSKASSRSPVMGGWVDALDVISSRMRP